MHANRFRGYYGIPPGGFTVPQGGTKDLAFIHLPSLGVVGGIAQADEFGLVNRSNLNTDYTTDWTTLTGPKTGRRGLACNYQITNYGFKRTYVVSSDSGQVSVQDDVVTFVPDVSGWVNFTVNGRKFDVLVNTENIQKPTINKIVYSTDEGGEISMSLSPFRVFEGSDFHLSSDFQLSYQANFGDNLLVDKKQQPASQPNFVLSGFQTESVVYARALVDGIQFGSTDWGPTRIYQIPRVIDGNRPNQSGGSIDETAVSLVIPAGGSITITTDSGFNQTYTSSQNIDIPVGSSIVTIVGHGTNGSTTQNPGQIAISPSGPIYEEQAIPTAMIMLQGMNFPLTGFAKTVFSDEQVILGFGAKNVVTHHVTPIGKEVIVGYLNPGQPYIAPFTQRTNGLPSVVSLQGNVYTFPGGIGEAATVLTRTHFLLLTTIVDNGGTLNPVSVVTTIGGNGSVSLSTEKGFAETVTSSKTSTVPAGSNVLTIKGRGGNGGTVSNPGQSYIAPSGPVYKTETTGSAGQPYIAPSGAVYRTETTNNPGQPYIAPSGPVYKTVTTGNPGQPYIAPSDPVYKIVTSGSWEKTGGSPGPWFDRSITMEWVDKIPPNPPEEAGSTYTLEYWVTTFTTQEAQAVQWLNGSETYAYQVTTSRVLDYYANPGQPYIASTLVTTQVLDYYTNPGQAYIAPTSSETQVFDHYTNPGQPYIASTLVTTQVLDYYTNPGQAYIAPSNSSTTGSSTTVTVMGQVYSFPGGIGIPSVEVTKTHLLTSNSSSTSGFGTSLSVTRDAGLLIIGTPSSETSTSSQPGAIAVYDVVNDNPVLKNRFFSETPPSSVVLSIPAGGSVQIKTAGGLDQTLTTSQTFTIPASSGDVTFIGKGGPGGTINSPGQPYIAPSGPIYDTVTNVISIFRDISYQISTNTTRAACLTNHQNGTWYQSAPEPFDPSVNVWGTVAYNNLPAVGSDWVNYTGNQGAAVLAAWITNVDRGASVPAEERYQVTVVWTLLDASGQRLEYVEAVVGYTNPGQTYVAPSVQTTTGVQTTVSFKGRTITFPGGLGGVATPQTQQVLGGLNNSLGKCVFATALGNHLFAGAPNDFQTYDNAGSVYRLYKETDGNWKLGQRIVSPTPLLNAVFGYQITANEDGSRLFISSVGENAVYYFKNVAGVYTFQQKIQASDTPSTGFFGESITCDALGNTLVIGAPTKASGSNFGAVYIFTTTDGVSFGQQTKLVPTTAGTTLTYVVPVTGELQVKEFDSSGVLLVTSDLSNTGTLTLNSLTRTLQTRGAGAKSSVNSPTKITYDGVEYVYPSAVLGKPDELFIDIPRVLLSKAFGEDVGISANGLRIWVSAPQATSRFSEQGVVFNYKYNGTIWKEGTRLSSLEPATNGSFGKRLSVADTGSTVVIGDPAGNEGMGMLCMVTEEATGNYDVLNLVYKTLSSLNNFGREVGISGNGYLQLASNPKMDNDRGAVYLFNS